jgi:outer membrane receptor protein involved in Fe transport
MCLPTLILVCGLLILLVLPNVAFGQGTLTGTVVGRAVDPEGTALPGVTVTATSTSLQGSRVAYTSATGDFILPNLPSGTYRVVFALEGMTTIEQIVVVELGRAAKATATLQVTEIEESIEVVADIPTAVVSKQVSANYDYNTVDRLPIDREPISIAKFAPGVSDRSEAVGQISISGGIGYDNLVMMDGVDSTFFIWGNGSGPTLFPTEVGLFIEDAIDETQVLTGTLSAEYGRFSGGVVNAITKRGGNQFKGTVRVDMTNPAWREESPLEEDQGIENESDRNDLFSATLGGYILRDSLWFFLAGSDTSRSNPTFFPVTGAPQPDDFDNQRYEIKLTGNIGGNHTVEGLALQNNSDLVFALAAIDPRTIDSTSVDHEYWALRYTGIFGRNLLAEARYSDRQVLNTGIGGSSTDIRDSPFYDPPSLFNIGAFFYNAPVFDEADPSLNFDDQNLSGIVSYFLSSEKAGSHELRLGLERFSQTQRGGNSQSSTGFLFWSAFLRDSAGEPVYDSQGRLQPVFEPFASEAYNGIADRDAVLDTTTTSLFVNDVWRLNDRWSFNLGLRYEQVKGDATPDIEVADFDSIVPRLAVTYSPKASGRFRITAAYNEYVGRASSELFKKISTSRNVSWLDYFYIGPAGVGFDFAPGFDLDNYVVYNATFPTVNTFFEPGIRVPKSREISLSGAMQLPGGGFVEAALIDRTFQDAFEDFIEIGNGSSTIDTPSGPFVADNIVYRNTDLSKRDYLALQVQGRHRFSPTWTLDGHWTWEIENDGNFVGEDFGNPALPSIVGDYPELFVEDRYFPTGALPSHLEHKLRVWTNYGLRFGRAGDLDLTLLFRYDSPLTYSHTAWIPLSEVQRSRDPGYASPPFGQIVYFDGRGTQTFDDLKAFDLVTLYQIPVWRSVEPWIKIQVRNLFDTTPKRNWDIGVAPDFAGPVDANGIPTEFIRSPTYGEAFSPSDYYPGREFLVSLGIRF